MKKKTVCKSYELQSDFFERGVAVTGCKIIKGDLQCQDNYWIIIWN